MNKKIGLILGVLVTTLTVFATNGDDKNTAYKIDTKESKVYWTGKKITGSSHTGHISIGSGNLLVDGETVVGGELNIDLNTIVCTDIENEEYNKKLIGHLKNDDFFGVENNPNAKFEIVSIKPAEDGSGYKVIGKLSLKGITNEISFPAKVNVSGGKVTALGTALIDRTKWDIKYGSDSFFKGLGDNAIKNEFEIRFELIANVDIVN